MKSIFAFFGLLAFAATASAQQGIAEFKWNDPAQTVPRGAVATNIDGRAALKIENTNDTPLQVSLLTVAAPKITTDMYAMRGEIRYDNVHGDGYLEMWNYFPAEKPGGLEGQYFSRTLGESGEMGKISGTSDWRPFALPFNSKESSSRPTKLQLNLILQGRGTVYLGPFKLMQFTGADSQGSSRTKDAWWSNKTSVRIFPWLGGGIGCLGGLIGVLGSLGKGRNFIIGVLKIQFVAGVISLIAGLAALGEHQPYAVWYPLLLLGILLSAISPGLIPTVRKRFEEQELRRMQAIDTFRA